MFIGVVADCWRNKCNIDELITLHCEEACGKKGYEHHSGYETYTSLWPPKVRVGELIGVIPRIFEATLC
jgi:hypothetical protein